MDKLKPCPFCGCERKNRIIGTNYKGEYRTEHFCKFTILGRKFHKGEEETIKEWNSRSGFLSRGCERDDNGGEQGN